MDQHNTTDTTTGPSNMEQPATTPPINTPPTPTAPTPSPTPTPKSGGPGGGPIVATIIIIALLILSGLYFWGAQLNKPQSEQLPLIPGDDAMMEQKDGDAMMQSDSLDDISADLSNDDLTDIEAEIDAALKDMEAEIDASAK